ncbi:hypothetical protein E2C01_005310 [Portunus trituberculatus]|uniref:Uncharacterized protein n=1 Tax=Portunus trituberculatus TaxID=210409 RepID=A0A5B7CWB5_PORTR|nr:hypothetical protein [Portunus trituberculatus]
MRKVAHKHIIVPSRPILISTAAENLMWEAYRDQEEGREGKHGEMERTNGVLVQLDHQCPPVASRYPETCPVSPATTSILY